VKGHLEVHPLVTALQDPTFDALFGAPYQSTDESAWEDVVSDNTDEEMHTKKATHLLNHQAPWKLHPPTYHVEKVNRNKI
jgi:hypothetical protein